MDTRRRISFVREADQVHPRPCRGRQGYQPSFTSLSWMIGGEFV